MDTFAQFQMLGRKQLAIQDGINELRGLRSELRQLRSAANIVGTTAVVANATLIPLNCIINAFELKAANSAYQSLVRHLYDKLAKSGTRIDGQAKTGLAVLKLVVVGELKRRALTHFIPGVNIMIGLTEDSLALYQTMHTVAQGDREFAAQFANVDRNIDASVHQLMQIGIQLAEILRRTEIITARTA